MRTARLNSRGLRTLSAARRTQLRSPRLSSRGTPVDINALKSQIEHLPKDQQATIFAAATASTQRESRAEHMTPENYQAMLLRAALAASDSAKDYDTLFWSQVSSLARNRRAWRSPEYIKLFLDLFEAAKQTTSSQRTEAVRMVGSFIYRSRTVRLDPINEVEFLDALVGTGRVFQALALWRSRVDKPDVSNTVYWPEVGALYYIDAGLPVEAHNIALRLRASKGGVPPRLVLALIEAFSRREGPELDEWVSYLLDAELKGSNTDWSDVVVTEEDLKDRMNDIPKVKATDLQVALEILVRARQWDAAAKVANCVPVLPPALPWLATLRKQSRPEPSIFSLFEVIVERSPQMVGDPEMIAGLLASFGRRGQLEEVRDILEGASDRGIKLTPTQQTAVLRSLWARNRNSAIELAAEFATPDATAAVARSFRRRDRRSFLKTAFDTQNLSLNSALALEVLKAGNPSNLPLASLGLGQRHWRWIWTLATRGGEDCRSLFQSMLQYRSENGPIYISLNLVETIVQAFLLNGDREGAAAVLLYIGSYLHHKIPLALASSILQTSLRVRPGMQMRAVRPSTAEIPFPKDQIGVDSSEIAKRLDVNMDVAKLTADSWAHAIQHSSVGAR